MSVIARAVFTGRERARVVGDADPYGWPWGGCLPDGGVRAPRPTGGPWGVCLPDGGLGSGRPTGNGMVTAGADVRIGPHRSRRRKAHRT